jgi:undecaprenyl-diphosphatase
VHRSKKVPVPFSHRFFAPLGSITALVNIGGSGGILEPGNLVKMTNFLPRFSWGLVISIVALCVFALVGWQSRVADSPLGRFDLAVAEAMRDDAARHPEWLDFLRAATHFGGIPVMTGLAIVGCLTLLVARQRRLALLWVVAATLGAGVNLTVKVVIGRQRPDEALRDTAVTERNESFPSGHSMGAVIGYGSLAYVGVVLLRRRWAKILFAGLLAALVLLIGVSRIYLRAHWCSDVIGGFSLGLCWMWACITLIGQRDAPEPQQELVRDTAESSGHVCEGP